MTEPHVDAGTRHYDHYLARLPRWRYIIRQTLLPLIRAETPPLARMQQLTRSPILDSYFAFAANLGTHTFFMVFLPVLFWCGYDESARAVVNLLAAGVIVSGIIKDLLCLPRPVSPPLQRITMSGSAALEYGFPSTHSTNASSVALYFIYVLSTDAAESLHPNARLGLTWLCYIYAFSIAFGRLYCGMHGFTDVISGSALGALLTAAQIRFGEAFYQWLIEGSFLRPLLITFFLMFMVRTHPEPADNCPCFDDSVSFAGVMVGIVCAQWNVVQPHSMRHLLSILGAGNDVNAAPVPFASLKTLIRIPLGVAIIVSFRAVTKPLLFRILPPIFRVIEALDLDIPRRFFLKASQYRTVPSLQRDDNILPSRADMGKILGEIRRRRGRAVSVGPQSIADAYEVIAYNEEAKRRSRSNSLSSGDAVAQNHDRNRTHSDSLRQFLNGDAIMGSERKGHSKSAKGSISALSKVEETASKTTSRDVPAATPSPRANGGTDSSDEEDAEDRRAIFSSVPRSRIRYDVEVVTKLIVYAGIAWLAVEGCLGVFELVGLGQ